MKDEILIDITHPVVRDHAVNGKHLFPGVAYIDLLYQLLRDRGHSYREIELRNLAIYRPLLVDEEGDVLLEISWEPKSGDGWYVVVEGEARQKGRVTGAKQRYVTAQMLAVSPADFTETLDLEAIWSEAASTVSAEQVYEQWRRQGLFHKGLMKAKGEARVTGSAIYVDLAAGTDEGTATNHLLFHPGLVDGSLVVASGALRPLSSAQDQVLRLPLSYGSFRAASTLQDRCLARIHLDSLRHRTGLSHLTVDFFDGSGKKIAALEDLASQPWIEPRPKKPKPATVGSDIRNAVRRVIAQKLRLAENAIGPSANFTELGLVSADLLDCAQRIESLVDRPLSPTLLFEYTTLDELSAHLQEHSSPPVVREGPQVVTQTSRAVLPAISEAEVAIIGIAGRFPQAANTDQLWENLKSGRDCITEIPEDRWNHSLYYHSQPGTPGKTDCKWGGFLEAIDQFDPLFFNISPREAELMDPQGRLFLETVWSLLEASAHTRATLRDRYRHRVGVYVGAMYQHYRAAEANLESSAITSLSSYSAIANRVSYIFGLQGPSLAIDTMCSSAMTAIHTACKDLRLGECELAIAGGVNLSLHPKKYLGLSHAQLTGNQANSRSFGRGNGYLPAEVVGAVLLKPLSRAVRDGDRVLAVIKSTAVNHGGRSNGYSIPNPRAQMQLIEEVLRRAGIDAGSISYVEAAANGSSTGDLVEMTALNKVFADPAALRSRCPIGSVKSNIGHAEAASGISQLAKVVLQMQHGMLVPSIKADPVNESLRFEESAFSLQRDLQQWERISEEIPRRALINSFGAGGAYAAMVVEEYLPMRTQPAAPADAPQPQVVLFSARTAERVKATVQLMLHRVEHKKDFSLADFAYTLQLGREAMESRVAMIVADREQLVRAMREYLEEPTVNALCHESVPVFRGEIPVTSAIRDLLSGNLGDLVMDALVKERDLEKMALLWIQGFDIPWDLLHRGATRRMIDLPTYPFARMRCWIDLEGHGTRTEQVLPTHEIVQKLSAGSDAGALRRQVSDFLLRFLADSLKVSPTDINPARNLQVYGFDSLAAMRLVRTLEAQLGILVTGRAMMEHNSLDALCNYLVSQMETGRESSGRFETRHYATQTAEQALELFRTGELSLHQMEELVNLGAIE